MELIRDKEKCYLRCEHHNWYYDGKPPLVSGCASCWFTYFMGQRAQMKPEYMDEQLEALEGAIKHVIEAEKNGTWDFVPYDRPEIKVEKE